MPFVCECGRVMQSQSGFTLHKKTCSARPPLVPQTGENVSNQAEAPVPILPLTSSERNAIQKLIIRRQDTILKALATELDGKPEHIYDVCRREKGITLTPQQLDELIKVTTEQIETEIEKHVGKERERIEITIGDLDEEFMQKEREMKERHKKEWTELAEQKKQKKEELRSELRNTEERVAQEIAKDLIEKKKGYQVQLATTKTLEVQIKVEAERRMALLTNSKGRLEHIIRDATGRALEKLWTVDTRKEAAGLVESIPTVTEAIKLCQSPEGMASLFRRLDPSIAELPAPATIDVPAEEVEEREEEVDEEDTDYARRRRDREHDEVYEETEARSRRTY